MPITFKLIGGEEGVPDENKTFEVKETVVIPQKTEEQTANYSLFTLNRDIKSLQDQKTAVMESYYSQQAALDEQIAKLQGIVSAAAVDLKLKVTAETPIK